MLDSTLPIESDKKNSNYQNYIPMNVWCILLKRKWIIFNILAISLISACLHVYFTTPIYESTAILRVGQVTQIGQVTQGGQVGQSIFLEQPLQLSERIKEKYNISASVNRATNSIALSASGPTAAIAQKNLSDITDAVVQEHGQLYAQFYSLQEKRVTLLKGQIKVMDAEKVDYSERIIESSQSRNEMSNNFVLGGEKNRLIQLRAELERQLIEASLSISKIAASPTQLLKEPTLPIVPSTPKPSYELGVATIFGVVFGIFMVLFIEFINILRQKSIKK